MHWAADRGHESIIRLLAKYGADLNVRDEDGQTPLFYGEHFRNVQKRNKTNFIDLF